MPRTATVIQLATHRRKSHRPSLNRDEAMARLILHSISLELPSAEYFTREDLLQLRPLQSVATITRYRAVCETVSYLIASRRLVPISRTELCFSSHSVQARQAINVDAYESTILRLITTQTQALPNQPFDVVDILFRWTTDPHLTRNAKRVIIRTWLKYLVRTHQLRPGPTHMTFISGDAQ